MRASPPHSQKPKAPIKGKKQLTETLPRAQCGSCLGSILADVGSGRGQRYTHPPLCYCVTVEHVCVLHTVCTTTPGLPSWGGQLIASVNLVIMRHNVVASLRLRGIAPTLECHS